MGGRDPDPNSPIWSPPNPYLPVRPDFPHASPSVFKSFPEGDIWTARSTDEKTPNGYLEAEVRIEYSPIGMLPGFIRNNGFINPIFDIYITPSIDVKLNSQLDFWNTEVSQRKGFATSKFTDFDNFRGLNIYSGLGASSRVALDVGIDLVLILDLYWYKITLIDIHPGTTALEHVEANTVTTERSRPG